MRRLALLVLLVAGCVRPADRPAVPDGRASSSADAPRLSAADLEARTHSATNRARRAERLDVLSWDDALADVARRHSADMARRGFFAHETPDGQTPSDRIARDGVTCQVRVGNRVFGVRENLAQMWRYSGWTDTRSLAGTTRTYDWLTAHALAARTVDGWLDSPGHRANLLFQHASREGIGVHVAPDDRVFVTQLLC